MKTKKSVPSIVPIGFETSAFILFVSFYKACLVRTTAYKYSYVALLLIVLLFSVSCAEKEELIKTYQMSIVRAASQINRDLQHYLNEIVYIASFTEDLYCEMSIGTIDGTNDVNSVLVRSDENTEKYLSHPSGVLYSQVETGKSVVFVSGYKEINKELKNIVYFTEALDSLFVRIVESSPEITQVYFTEKNSYIRLYPPYDILSYFNPGVDLTNFNFYYLANESFNPSQDPLFIKEPYFDKNLNDWIISAIAPVYFSEELQGAVGLDLSISMLLENWLSNDDIASFIMSDSGLFFAHDDDGKWKIGDVNSALVSSVESIVPIDNVENALARPEDDYLNQNLSLEIQNIVNKILNGDRYFVSSIDNNLYYILSAEINLLNWHLVYLIPN